MFSNVQRPLYKKSLPEPPKKPKKTSAVPATTEKDEQYFASLFAAVESPIKSPIPSAIEVAEQVYFTPGTIHKAGTSYPQTRYDSLSEKFDQQPELTNPNSEPQNLSTFPDKKPDQQVAIPVSQNTETLGSKPLPMPPLQPSTTSGNTASSQQAEKKDSYHISHQPNSLSSIFEENIHLSKPQDSANSNYNNPSEQGTDFLTVSKSAQQFSTSRHPQLQDSYSIESDETESLSSIENQSGLPSSTSLHSFKVPLPRQKVSSNRPKSVSIPQPRKETSPYSTSWKSESSLSLEKVKFSSLPDFPVFKSSGGMNPLKRISRALNALPGSNHGGSSKAKEAYSNLGRSSAERVEAYKRKIAELQKQRTDIHCWINIMKNRDRRAMNSKNPKHCPSVAHTSIAPDEHTIVPNTQKPRLQVDTSDTDKSDLQMPDQNNYQAPIADHKPKSHTELLPKRSVEIDYKLDIPIETSGSLFDWDHFDKELTKINKDRQSHLPTPSENHSTTVNQLADSSEERSLSVSRRSRRKPRNESNRSRPHSYHSTMHTAEQPMISHKHSSSFPEKMDDKGLHISSKPSNITTPSKGKSPSTYMKGDSDDETPLSIVASRVNGVQDRKCEVNE